MKTRTILLVEDCLNDEELTRIAFESIPIPIDLVVARDGAEGLQPLQGSSPLRPEMVLLDLMLPKVSGLEVLHRIHLDARTRLLPVVVMTSSNERVDLAKSYGLGANSYIRKPEDFEQFTEAVQQLGSYWLTLNQLPSAS